MLSRPKLLIAGLVGAWLAALAVPAIAQPTTISLVTATSAQPTYVEGSTSNPLSTNLTGDLRTIAKQSGTWTVSLPTGAATAANQSTEITNFGAIADSAYSGSATTAMGYLRAIAAAAIDTSNVNTNIAQINGVAPLMGSGATGTGSARVTVATDSPGMGSTGATAPSTAVLVGGNSAGLLTAIIQANASAAISVSTATTTQLVPLSGSTKIYVTAWDVVAAGTGNIKLVHGTGSSCGTDTTDLTGNYNLVAQAGLSKGGGLGPVIVVPAGKALCVTTSAAVGMAGSVAYTQF